MKKLIYSKEDLDLILTLELEETKRHLKEMKKIAQDLGDELHEITNHYVKTTDELNKYKDKLQQKENIIKEVREYIKNLTNFQIGYGLNENDIKRTMYASENNFVKDILEILDKGE